MGIRINKVAGYALTDLQATDEAATDARIDWQSWLINEDVEAPSVQEHLDWVERQAESSLAAKRHLPLLKSLFRGDPDTPLTQSAVWDPEYADPQVLALVPPGEVCRLRRTDDDIDYAEARRTNSTEPQVDLLDFGVGLSGGLWMDARNGQRLDGGMVRTLRTFQEAGITDVQELTSQMTYLGGERAEGITMADIVPEVPMSVRLLVEHAGLFVQSDTWRQLRPVIYSFWN